MSPRRPIQEPMSRRLAAECRALLVMLWAGYSRADAEEALRAMSPSEARGRGVGSAPTHHRTRRRPTGPSE